MMLKGFSYVMIAVLAGGLVVTLVGSANVLMGM